MANRNHLAALKQGVQVWNRWRAQHPYYAPELSKADLHTADLIKADLTAADLTQANLCEAHLRRADLGEANLAGADLSRADLFGAHLEETYLIGANLQGANLQGADLRGADLRSASLQRANLQGADLCETDLRSANLQGAHLQRADLRHADLAAADLRQANLSGANLASSTLVRTNLEGADLTGCRVYGASVWAVNLRGTAQSDLVITGVSEAEITVDNIEVAQFIYLLLNNERIRQVFDTITSKVVLILGRFTPKRKALLDAIRQELRRRNYLPVLFDFEKPASRDLTETISTLAHMARFVIADITDAKSVPQELMKIVPALPSVPVQPLLLASKREWGMFRDLQRYPWVLAPVRYKSQKELLAKLSEKVIVPAEAKASEQIAPK
jgi:uncharacterized protein YjbI with pentapeptide repeats